jgi:hypothetical protein
VQFRHVAAKILGCKQGVKMEAHVMSVIQSAYAVPSRWGLLGVLCSALLALFLFNPSVSTAQEVKQIKLTEKHMQGRRVRAYGTALRWRESR